MRYRVWQSNKNQYLHLLCEEGAEALSTLPAAIRHLGRPWTGGAEGDVNRLRLPYRLMLAEQGFAARSKSGRAAFPPALVALGRGQHSREKCQDPSQEAWLRG